ncbi:MAG: dipeptidase [Planctomycetota bacterium]
MRFILFVAAAALFVSCASRKPFAGDAQAHANKLAQQLIIVDGHIDVPYRLNAKMEDISIRTPGGDFDYVRAKQGGLDAPFFSIFTPADLEEKGGSKALADKLIDDVEKIIAQSPDKFALAKTVADVYKISAAKKIAILYGMENGSPIEGKLTNLDHFFERGVRYITLCHGKDNHICDSSYDTRHSAQGLTKFGEEVVRRMNELGIVIDVSHISDDAFYDVINLSKAPVFASHSSCREFTPGFERNMSNEMIRILAKHGGVIMINFGSAFIRDDIRTRSGPIYQKIADYLKENNIPQFDPRAQEIENKIFAEANLGYATVQDVAEHIEHVIKIAGVDYVGLGSDFDGVGDSLPTGLKDVSMYPNLIAELLKRGYNDSEIKKICGGNALRVMEGVEATARKLSKK